MQILSDLTLGDKNIQKDLVQVTQIITVVGNFVLIVLCNLIARQVFTAIRTVQIVVVYPSKIF